MPPVVLFHRRLIYGPPNVIQDKILRTKIFFFTGRVTSFCFLIM